MIDSPNQIEEIKRYHETIRIELDRQNNFNDQFKIDVLSKVDASRESISQSLEFAKIWINSLIVMNGGALISFPALAELFGEGVLGRFGWAIGALIFFSLGLVSATFATAFAFRTLEVRSEMFDHLASKNAEALHGMRAKQDGQSDTANHHEKRAKDFNEKRDDAIASFARWRTAAIVAASLSVFLFCGGGICSAIVISAPPEPHTSAALAASKDTVLTYKTGEM